MRVILASTSPRRRALLALLGIPFEVRHPTSDERLVPGRTAQELASYFAQAKASSVAKDDPDAVVVGSDTLIELDGSVLGKPSNLSEARTMLRLLAGREHCVHTAVTVSYLSRLIETTRLSTAHVRLNPFDAVEHERYLATGDSLGKAGAYSIQGPGADLIQRFDGDFTTIVGLPLRLVATLLVQIGMTIPVDLAQLYEIKPIENWTRLSQR